MDTKLTKVYHCFDDSEQKVMFIPEHKLKPTEAAKNPFGQLLQTDAASELTEPNRKVKSTIHHRLHFLT